jgi:hypothetical protein
MELLESYLHAVKRYLPRGQRDDIIRELSEDLRAQIEERADAAGRPLTDEELFAFFKQHGDPMTVARRYRQGQWSLSLGWELIGPELFPMYLIFLASNLTITFIAVVVVALLIHVPITPSIFVVPVVAQIACLTLVFTGMNFVRRKFPQPWYYPPAAFGPMMPIGRGYCFAGLVLWVPVAIWWLALPHFPAFVLGSASKHLEFASSWHRFYLPVLLLILASISQRVINLFRPNWTWLVPSMRMVINAAAVPILYFLVFQTHTVFVVSAGQDPAQFQKLAEDLNNFFSWGILGPWLWFYTGLSAPVYAYYCLPYLRRLFRGQTSQSPAAAGPSGKNLPKGLLL